MSKNRVCVYCGADEKLPASYKQIAFEFGQALATHGLTLVSGGGNLGLMKQINDGHAAIDQTGSRHGVIPIIFKEYGLEHSLVPEENLHWVDGLNARIQKFYELSDNFVVLPGGFGTLHELFDCLVHSQFGLIDKRIYLLNIDGFWDGLIQQLRTMVAMQALQPQHFDHLIIINTVPDLIAHIVSGQKTKLSQGFEDRYWEKPSASNTKL